MCAGLVAVQPDVQLQRLGGRPLEGTDTSVLKGWRTAQGAAGNMQQVDDVLLCACVVGVHEPSCITNRQKLLQECTAILCVLCSRLSSGSLCCVQFEYYAIRVRTRPVLSMSPHLACGCKGRHLQVVQCSLPDELLLPGQCRLALTLHAVKVLQQLCVFLHLLKREGN